MERKLIIDEDSVYEIDEMCMREKDEKRAGEGVKTDKTRENGRKTEIKQGEGRTGRYRWNRS